MNEESGSSGDQRAVGGQFQVLGPYAAKLCWPVDVRVEYIRREIHEDRCIQSCVLDIAWLIAITGC